MVYEDLCTQQTGQQACHVVEHSKPDRKPAMDDQQTSKSVTFSDSVGSAFHTLARIKSASGKAQRTSPPTNLSDDSAIIFKKTERSRTNRRAREDAARNETEEDPRRQTNGGAKFAVRTAGANALRPVEDFDLQSPTDC